MVRGIQHIIYSSSTGDFSGLVTSDVMTTSVLLTEYWGSNPRLEVTLYIQNKHSPIPLVLNKGTLSATYSVTAQFNGETFTGSNTVTDTISHSVSGYTFSETMITIPLNKLTDANGNYLSGKKLTITAINISASFTNTNNGDASTSITSLSSNSLTTTSYPMTISLYVNSPDTTKIVTEIYSQDSGLATEVTKEGAFILTPGKIGQPVDLVSSVNTGIEGLFLDNIGCCQIFEGSELKCYGNGLLTNGEFTGIVVTEDKKVYLNSEDTSIVKPPRTIPSKFVVNYKNESEGWESSTGEISSAQGPTPFSIEPCSHEIPRTVPYLGWSSSKDSTDIKFKESQYYRLLGDKIVDPSLFENGTLKDGVRVYRIYQTNDFIDYISNPNYSGSILHAVQGSSNKVTIKLTQEDRISSLSNLDYYNKEVNYGSVISEEISDPSELNPPMLVRSLYQFDKFEIKNDQRFVINTADSLIASFVDSTDSTAVQNYWKYNNGPAVAGIVYYGSSVDSFIYTTLCIVSTTPGLDHSDDCKYIKSGSNNVLPSGDPDKFHGTFTYEGQVYCYTICESTMSSAYDESSGQVVKTFTDKSGRFTPEVTSTIFTDSEDDFKYLARTLLEESKSRRVLSSDRAPFSTDVLVMYTSAPGIHYYNPYGIGLVGSVPSIKTSPISMRSQVQFKEGSFYNREVLIYKKSNENKWIGPTNVSFVVRKYVGSKFFDFLVDFKDLYYQAKTYSHGRTYYGAEIYAPRLAGTGQKEISFYNDADDKVKDHTVRSDMVILYTSGTESVPIFKRTSEFDSSAPENSMTVAVYGGTDSNYKSLYYNMYTLESYSTTTLPSSLIDTHYFDIEFKDPTGSKVLGKSKTYSHDDFKYDLDLESYPGTSKGREYDVILDQFVIGMETEENTVSDGIEYTEKYVIVVTLTSSSVEIPVDSYFEIDIRNPLRSGVEGAVYLNSQMTSQIAYCPENLTVEDCVIKKNPFTKYNVQGTVSESNSNLIQFKLSSAGLAQEQTSRLKDHRPYQYDRTRLIKNPKHLSLLVSGSTTWKKSST